jgi:hypothetical protein
VLVVRLVLVVLMMLLVLSLMSNGLVTRLLKRVFNSFLKPCFRENGLCVAVAGGKEMNLCQFWKRGPLCMQSNTNFAVPSRLASVFFSLVIR